MYAALLNMNLTSPRYTICVAIDSAMGIVFYYLWVWRFWLIFYDTKWTISVLNRRWQNLINPQHVQLKKRENWFLTHRSKHGNSEWIFIHRILPIIIISSLLMTIPPVLLSYAKAFDDNYMWNVVHLISSSSYYVPFIFLAVILMKTPEFNDEFFIISELKRIFITFCADNITHLVVFLIPT